MGILRSWWMIQTLSTMATDTELQNKCNVFKRNAPIYARGMIYLRSRSWPVWERKCGRILGLLPPLDLLYTSHVWGDEVHVNNFSVSEAATPPHQRTIDLGIKQKICPRNDRYVDIFMKSKKTFRKFCRAPKTIT